MAFKQPNGAAQLMSSMGMAMPGGMKSGMSKQPVTGRGKGFATMEAGLLKRGKVNPKAAAAGKPGRQFFNDVAGGDSTGLKKVRGFVSKGSTPPAIAGLKTRRTK